MNPKGRPPGSPNRQTLEMHAICLKHNVNVWEAMVILVSQEFDPDKKFDKLERLARYLYSQRKAVDVLDENPFNALTAKQKLEVAKRAIPILEAEAESDQ